MKCYMKDYPRPQFVRSQWENLNGEWEFAFDDELSGMAKAWYKTFPGEHLKIRVPYTYETKMSGIQDERAHPCVWYHRGFLADAASMDGKRLILHFEGSDFRTRVWVNGLCAGSHTGGYARFSFDITDLVRAGENDITVMVEDSADVQQPRGKQRWLKDSYDCWYVQTTGIWKTVWTELVPEIRMDRVKITPVLEKNLLELEFTVSAPQECFGPDLMVQADISLDGLPVNRVLGAAFSDHVVLSVDMNRTGQDGELHSWDVKTWTPEEPSLYDLELSVRYKAEVTDTVLSYCAMREIRIDGPNVLLNGNPLYQRLILDQGYWKDSHLTPPDEDALILDIDRIRALGFNGVRKHQKVEDERFLYWCDVKGMLVWSEAPAAYRFTDYAVQEFTREWMEIVEQNYNHPCIITWTPFNESWGINRVETRADQQHFTEAIYHLTKSLDPYRPVIVNDGWEHTVSDILTLHDYEEKGEILKERYVRWKDQIFSTEVYHNGFKSALANGYAYRGQPVIISEYGGIAFDNGDSGWGYGHKVTDEDAFVERFDAVTTAVRQIPYVCGYCYTQVSDVQQEINGLMDSERNLKVNPDRIRAVNLRKAGD